MRLALCIALLAASCTTEDVRITHAPSAFAGFDRTAIVGQKTPLDGSESADPDGRRLSYAWRIEASPAGSMAMIDSPMERTTNVTPDLPGSYVISLTVSNGALAGRDLVGIFARTASTSSAAEPHLSLAPAICNVRLGGSEAVGCSASGTIAIAPEPAMLTPEDANAARIAWTLFRAPPGADLASTGAAAMLTGSPIAPSPLSIAPTIPGEYWFAARLVIGDRISPPAFASIAFFDDSSTPIADRPLARIDAQNRAAPDDRVLLDGQRSMIPAPPTPQDPRFSWTLVTDPSAGNDMLLDAATGCPKDQCRVLVPTTVGTYVIALHVASGDLDGATALFALEVKR